MMLSPLAFTYRYEYIAPSSAGPVSRPDLRESLARPQQFVVRYLKLHYDNFMQIDTHKPSTRL